MEEEDKYGLEQPCVEELRNALRDANVALIVGKYDTEKFNSLKQQADDLLLKGVEAQIIGLNFIQVANEYLDHDYISDGENLHILTAEEIRVKYINWQKWYIYKLFACHYLQQILTKEDERLCDKGLTATEFVVPLSNSSKEDIERNAETFYGQQIKMKRAIDQILSKMGIITAPAI